MNFAQNLKTLRKASGMAQYEIANLLGRAGRSTVCHYESGKEEPTIKSLCALADYFGVTTDQLLGRAPLPNAKMKTR